MKTYEACFDSTKEGVYSISLVDDPATKEMFIYMNSDTKIEMKEVDKEQRILLGVVLKPDQLIYRFNQETKEEFNIVFRADTIKELSHNFFKRGYQTNSKLEHETPIEGVTIAESWIVEDSENDKANALGLKVEKGTWVAMMKVDSEEIWSDYVKTGEVKGFSVDAFMELKEINLSSNLNSDIKMSDVIKESIKSGFAELKELFLSKEKKETVELGSVPSGDIVVQFDGEELVSGAPVWMLGEGDVKIPLPVGEYPVEGGVLVVAEEGVAGELRADEAPDAEAETKAELAEGGEATPAPSAPESGNKFDEIKQLIVKFKEHTDAKFDKLEKENVALKSEVLELSAQPASKAVGSRVEMKVNPDKLTNYQKLQVNRGTLVL